VPRQSLYSVPATYISIPEPHYPFHDKIVVVSSCGRLCLYRKKINLSNSLASQAVGIKKVETGIGRISFMDYDVGISIWRKNSAALRQPRGAESVTHILGANCSPMSGMDTSVWRRERDSNPR
jgi:hypothetical protein